MSTSKELSRELEEKDNSQPAKVADLSELDLKGYAPVPSKGQDKTSFESEELSKKGVTWAQFQSTNYFKDHSGDPEFVAMLAADSRENEKGGEKEEEKGEKKALNDDIAKDQEEIMKAKADAVPMAKVPKENEVVLSSNTLRTDKPSIAVQGGSKSLELLLPPKPVVKDSFISKVTIEPSLDKYYHKQSANGLEFEPEADPKLLPLKKLAWIQKQLSDYEGLRVGIYNDYIPEDRATKTRESQAGFNMRAYYATQTRPEESGRLWKQWEEFESPYNTKKVHTYDRTVNMMGLKSEYDYTKKLMIIESHNLFEIEDWHAFHRLWDSEVLRLKTLDPRIILQKTRVWMDHNFRNYDIIMDHNPSFAMTMCDYVKSHIERSVALAVNEDRTVLSNLLRNIKYKRNTIDYANTIPDAINASDAALHLRYFMTILQMSRWVEGDVNLVLTTASVPVILGLLIIRAFTPKRVWSARAIMMMDNYLALWFVSAMPFFKGTVTIDEMKKDVNVLENILADGSMWASGNDQSIFKQFFDGWSDRGNAGRFELRSVNGDDIPKMLSNVNRTTPLWHRSEIGYSAMDKSHLIRVPDFEFDQINRFTRLVGVITKKGKNINTWNFGMQSELREPLVRILADISTQKDKLSDLAYAVNRANRFASLHTLTGCHKKHNKWVQIMNRSLYHTFDPVAFAKMFYSIDSDKVDVQAFDNSFYMKSLGVHALCTDIGDGLQIAKAYMTDPRWTKTEIIEEAFKFVKSHSLKQFLFTEFKERKRILPLDKLKARSFFKDKVDATEIFFKALSPAELKYAESFIYANGYRRDLVSLDPTEKFRILLVARPGKDLPTLNIFDLEDKIVLGQLAEYLGKTKQVRFKIPIKIKAGPVSSMVNMPISLGTKGKTTVSEIVVGYHDIDDRVRTYTDEFAMLNLPEYYVDVLPWNNVETDFPMNELVHEMKVWSELDLNVQFDYVAVRARPTF
jgi:hypothetical protein